MKHGLCASVVVPESAELIQARTLEMFDSLAPQDQYQTWVCNRVGLLTIRVDRCERMDRRARDKVCLRALTTWDVDREAEIERLAAKLACRPEEVSKELRRTKHGCEWLIRRWSMLAHAAESNQSWSDDQTRLAFDLLGTPAAFRQGSRPGLELDDSGRIIDAALDPAAVARRQVDSLKLQRDIVAELDEVERHLAESDLSHDSDAECRRLRRYETRLHREIRWCIAELKSEAFVWRRTRPDLRPTFDPGIEPEPAFESDAAPDLAPEPPLKPVPKSADEIAAEGWTPELISPPFDLEPEEFPEPGQSADIPAILRSRKLKRQARADARREARRRKLERLRS